MRNIGKVRLVFVAIIVITLASAEAAWQSRPIVWGAETQVTKGGGDSRLVDIATDQSGAVRLVWEDNRDGSNQVYYKGSSDNGLTWAQDVKLSNLGSAPINPLPRLASSGTHVLVFFSESTGTGERLVYATSGDAGATFSAQQELTHDSGYQANPVASVEGPIVHLVWQNLQADNERLYYMRTMNAGATWSPESVLTSGTGLDRHPAVAAVGSDVFVVWSRYVEGEEAVFFKTSHDGGDTWLPEVQLSGFISQAFSIFPSVATNGTRVDVVWNSGGVYYTQSPDAGSTWEPQKALTNDSRQYLAPRISSSGLRLQVAVSAISMQGNNANTVSSDIFLIESEDGGKSWNEPLSLTNHSARLQSLAPAITTREDATFVAWEDNRYGPFAIFIRSKPDFAELSNVEKRVVTYSLSVLGIATAAYVLLEIRSRRRKKRVRIRRRVRKHQRVRKKRKVR